MYPNWEYYVPRCLETSDIMNKCEWFIHLMNHDSFGIMIRGYLQPVQSNSTEFTRWWECIFSSMAVVHLFVGLKSWRLRTAGGVIPDQEETKHYQHLVNPMLIMMRWFLFNHGDELHDMNDSCLFLELSIFQTAMSSEFGVWVGIN